MSLRGETHSPKKDTASPPQSPASSSEFLESLGHGGGAETQAFRKLPEESHGSTVRLRVG